MLRIRLITAFAAVVFICLAVAFAGCGGSGPSSPPSGVGSAAVLSSLSPASVAVGGNGFTLTVNGSNFGSSVSVHWAGAPVPTTFINHQQVTATIAASLVASAEIADVTAMNANSSESSALQFSVNNPAPQITSISPDNAVTGGAPVLVTVNGSNFVDDATLVVGGSPRPTILRSGTELQTTISAADLATARSITVTVTNPSPAQGPSNQGAFTVTPFTTNPTPTLSSASDASVPVGWLGFPLTVHGTNFVAATVLEWDGVERQTTVVSSTELEAAIPASLLASPKTAQIAIVNPSPGGGLSGALPVQVKAVAPDAIGVIDRSDVGTDRSEADADSTSAAVSADGRFVVFVSSASTFVPNTPGNPNLFLRDTCIGAPNGCVPSVTLLSNSTAASPTNPAISGSARFVAFSNDSNVLLFDTCLGVSAGCIPNTQPIPAPPNSDQGQVSLSADGQFAVFLSGQFGCGDFGCNIEGQVFLAETCAGLPSACTPGSQAITQAADPFALTPAGAVLLNPSISPDGRFVIFDNSSQDLVLYDSCRGEPSNCTPSGSVVSVGGDGSPANAGSFGGVAGTGGRFVAFLSLATNLVPGVSEPDVLRIYLRDMCTGAPSGCIQTTTLISVAGNGMTADDPSISADGRYIAFASVAGDLVTGDTNGASDVFVRDTCNGASSGCTSSTERVSVALDGTQGNGSSSGPVISADGRFVVFVSGAKLSPGAPNSTGSDVYLSRR